MKIEVGKFYQSVMGLKVRVYAVEDTKDEFVHGAYLGEDGRWISGFWLRKNLVREIEFDEDLGLKFYVCTNPKFGLPGIVYLKPGIPDHEITSWIPLSWLDKPAERSEAL